jgi:uncharacterized protein YfiM (DUF2279 family)
VTPRARLTFALVLSLQGAPSDGWLGADKIKHFLLAGFVQSTSYSVLRATSLDHRSSLMGATALSAGVAVGKELSDRRSTGFSVRDLAWDAAGIGVSTALLDRIQR